eukprot:NODE_91_length_21557_cov_0.766660.p1 type:complete len:876 gc:universal NODE_91_length_21557_cov_0.766660:12445-9818(-)
MLEKKRVSKTLSFIPSQPILTSKPKLIDITDKQKNKEIIRERLFQLEQYRREQLSKMKKRNHPYKKKPQMLKTESNSTNVLSEKIIQSPNLIPIYTALPRLKSNRRLKSYPKSITKMNLDPELIKTSAVIDQKLQNIIFLSKSLSSKVQHLITKPTYPHHQFELSLHTSLVDGQVSSDDDDTLSEETVDQTDCVAHYDESSSSLRIKNINYIDAKCKSAYQILQSKSVLKTSAGKFEKYTPKELPHSTSVSDLSSISDNEPKQSLPILVNKKDILRKKRIESESDIMITSTESRVLFNLEPQDMKSGLSEIYNNLFESNDSLKSLKNTTEFQQVFDLNMNDPKYLIATGLERLLKYDIKSSNDSNKIVSLLKSILETKILVDNFTTPDITDLSEISEFHLQQKCSTENESVQTFQEDKSEGTQTEANEIGWDHPLDFRSEEKILSRKTIPEMIEFEDNIRNEFSAQNNSQRENSISELIKAGEFLSNQKTESVPIYSSPRSYSPDTISKDSVASQIDSLISAALDLSNITNATKDLERQPVREIENIYLPDFESISQTHEVLEDITTDTSVVKGRVNKLKFDIESKLKEQQELDLEKQKRKRERKLKMREQEVQLKDRLSQIEDSIAEMLKGNFNESIENPIEQTLWPSSKPKLDVFEVERNIENIVEKVFLSNSRELSQNSSRNSSLNSQKGESLIDDSSLANSDKMTLVCDGVFEIILEEAVNDMLAAKYVSKEIQVSFDVDSIQNLINLMFEDMPDDMTAINFPVISNRVVANGSDTMIILDLIAEAFQEIWTHFKSPTISKERISRELKKKVEVWLSYRADEFFDEVLMDEVKLEEKSWDAFNQEKENLLNFITNSIFQDVIDSTIGTTIL